MNVCVNRQAKHLHLGIGLDDVKAHVLIRGKEGVCYRGKLEGQELSPRRRKDHVSDGRAWATGRLHKAAERVRNAGCRAEE